MKTLLVPVDFTATSENAVNVAAEWSQRYGYERIILLKSFYDSVFESVTVAAEYSNFNPDCINTERQHAEAQLQQACRQLADRLPQVKVMTAVSEAPLLRALLEVVRTERPELIIAGSDNYSHSSGSNVAEHVIPIAKASPVRVLVVPSTYTYQPVADALVPCDLNTLEIVDKVNSLRSAPQWHDVRLHVLNVDAKESYLKRDSTFVEREDRLHGYLKNFQYQLHYRNDKNVLAGIKNFLHEQEVQLVIALPGRHSFLYNLTHSSISEALYRNVSKPVLILK